MTTVELTIDEELSALMMGLQKRYPDTVIMLAWGSDNEDDLDVSLVTNVEDEYAMEFLECLINTLDKPDTVTVMSPNN